MPTRDIIVIGASAGGFEAIQKIAAGLPADLPAAVFVTLHTYERSEGILPKLLNEAGVLPAAHAIDGEHIQAGRIYVAPPDYHLMLEDSRVYLSHGPKENMQRPCINVMFRSAAATYGERVTGVLLSGLLDDGAAGLWEIQQHHGATVVQDPEEATFRSMPDSAIRGLNVQYIVRLAEIPPLLARLSVADHNVTKPGDPISPHVDVSGQSCPECGGAMISVKMGGLREYRCHVGHRMGLQTMIAQKSTLVERALELALSQSEELSDLLHHALEEPSESAETLRDEIARRRKEQEALRDLTGNKKDEAAD